MQFLDEVATLQRRVHPVVMEHRRNAEQELAMSVSIHPLLLSLSFSFSLSPSLPHSTILPSHSSPPPPSQSAEGMGATRVALTVKDFNYYIGHAYVSLSRLHISMPAKPPRTLRLAAQRRTEMRRMMHQFRGAAPPRGEAPSGYIVDISNDDEAGDDGTSTRAIVNRDSGARGVGEGAARRPSPFGGGFPGLGGLFPPGLGLAVSQRNGRGSTSSVISLLHQ